MHVVLWTFVARPKAVAKKRKRDMSSEEEEEEEDNEEPLISVADPDSELEDELSAYERCVPLFLQCILLISPKRATRTRTC
jgi:hypothetical protein